MNIIKTESAFRDLELTVLEAVNQFCMWLLRNLLRYSDFFLIFCHNKKNIWKNHMFRFWMRNNLFGPHLLLWRHSQKHRKDTQNYLCIKKIFEFLRPKVNVCKSVSFVHFWIEYPGLLIVNSVNFELYLIPRRETRKGELLLNDWREDRFRNSNWDKGSRMWSGNVQAFGTARSRLIIIKCLATIFSIHNKNTNYCQPFITSSNSVVYFRN